MRIACPGCTQPPSDCSSDKHVRDDLYYDLMISDYMTVVLEKLTQTRIRLCESYGGSAFEECQIW
jgi:hypothetical protein